jgi:hypothetical protein
LKQYLKNLAQLALTTIPFMILAALLGAFSVYPMLIVGRTMSWKTAARVFATVMALGIVCGAGTAIFQHAL